MGGKASREIPLLFLLFHLSKQVRMTFLIEVCLFKLFQTLRHFQLGSLAGVAHLLESNADVR